MPASNNDTKMNVSEITIKVGGAAISDKILDEIFRVEVDSSLGMPDMCVLRVYDDEVVYVDDDSVFNPGKELQISFAPLDDPTNSTIIFKGEIVALEADFDEQLGVALIVRAYDKSHRLNRGTKVRVFVNSKDSDIVQKIVGEDGLSANVEATTVVYPHVFQDGVTDWEFINMLARRNGYEVTYDNDKVAFRKASTKGSEIELKWGETLRAFRPRLSLAGQVNEVTVRGWDVAKKEAIVGKATKGNLVPQTGFDSDAGSSAQKAFNSAKHIEVRHPVTNQNEADKLAQAILDQYSVGYLEAEGVAVGKPTILAGEIVKITNVGTRFGGKYKVTSATHVYSPDGYDTYFKVEGPRPDTFSDLAESPSPAYQGREPWSGVVTALVTNNNDSEGKQGRVKLKFPWMDDQLEGTWARVCSPDAGNNRGIQWIPEVNDEVLVAFEHGDFNRPFVLGTLWNGKDAMPETQTNAVKDGKVTTRTIKSRTGHVIRLTEDDSNSKIELIDAKTQTSVTMDGQNKKITIDSKGDIDLTGTGKITIKGSDINIESTSGAVSVKSGTTLGMEAKTGATLKSQATVAVEAQATLDLKGTGPTTLQSSAITQVKGSLVKIN